LFISAAAAAQSAGQTIYDINVSDYQGDGDHHVELGEMAVVNFTVNGGTSTVTSASVYLNDTLLSKADNLNKNIYYGGATTAPLHWGTYVFRIVATMADGNTSAINVTQNVTGNYIGWIKIDHLWGPTQMFHTPIQGVDRDTDYYVGAVADIRGNVPDGNSITLSGGKPIQVPDINMTVDGGMLVNRTMECLIYLGKQNGTVPLNYTLKGGPYPVYYLDSNSNNITGTLDGSKAFANMTLGVGMINMTMTPRDPVVYMTQIYHDWGPIKTDENGDATLPVMDVHEANPYIVVVYDHSVSNGLGLVSAIPLYVVNYTSTIGLSYTDKNMAPKQVLNPGDNLMVNVTMPNATNQKYLFAAFAVPASDYKGVMDVNSTGMISDMNLTIDALTIHFKGNYNETIKNASRNLTYAQELVSGWSGSNLSASVGTSVGKSMEMPLKIKENGMTGQYILVTAAVEPESMTVVSFGQTTFNVVAPEQSICIPWYLILLIIIILILVIVAYWYYRRKKE
jgi:methanogen extracellular protein (TIGR04279 family)